jgi:hypothetical protein
METLGNLIPLDQNFVSRRNGFDKNNHRVTCRNPRDKINYRADHNTTDIL